MRIGNKQQALRFPIDLGDVGVERVMRKLGMAMAGGIAAAVVAVATGPAPAQSRAGDGTLAHHGPTTALHVAASGDTGTR